LGQAPKFLDRHYKTEHASDHVAKFRGNRLRDLEDLALKEKKNNNKNCCKTQGLPNYHSGQPNKLKE